MEIFFVRKNWKLKREKKINESDYLVAILKRIHQNNCSD